MKILSAKQQQKVDKFTIENEPISSLDLMERAATISFEWIIKQDFKDKTFHIFCGIGNNGGDGLVIARLLKLEDFDVKCYVVHFSDKCSADFESNQSRLEEVGLSINHISAEEHFNWIIEKEDIIIDALLGTGTTRPAEGILAKTINLLNHKNATIISIDLPTGMFCDTPNEKEDVIISADFTLTFSNPKLSFFLTPYEDFIGELVVLDIGLDKKYIDQLETINYATFSEEVGLIMKSRSKSSHKGSFGHSLIIAGAQGKYGAAILATQAAIRSGTGLCSVMCPQNGHDILQITSPEAMVIKNTGKEVLQKLDNYSIFKNKTIGIGPGIGTESDTLSLLIDILKNTIEPMVIDADALNLISNNPKLLEYIPKNSVLTPHPKEFQRLVGLPDNSFHRLQKQKAFSKKHKLIVVLKGHHTSITCPSGNVHFNTTGNAGMATGGAGDVLTGIITGLLAQKYKPLLAAILGVYLHGLAGDLALQKIGYHALKAQDIIENLPASFCIFEKE